jgi:hypothetical protein
MGDGDGVAGRQMGSRTGWEGCYEAISAGPGSELVDDGGWHLERLLARFDDSGDAGGYGNGGHGEVMAGFGEDVTRKKGSQDGGYFSGVADFGAVMEPEDGIGLAAEVVGCEGFVLGVGVDGKPAGSGSHGRESPDSAPGCRLQAAGNRVKEYRQ